MSDILLIISTIYEVIGILIILGSLLMRFDKSADNYEKEILIILGISYIAFGMLITKTPSDLYPLMIAALAAHNWIGISVCIERMRKK